MVCAVRVDACSLSPPPESHPVKTGTGPQVVDPARRNPASKADPWSTRGRDKRVKRARLAAAPAGWRWSSAAAHLTGFDRAGIVDNPVEHVVERGYLARSPAAGGGRCRAPESNSAGQREWAAPSEARNSWPGWRRGCGGFCGLGSAARKPLPAPPARNSNWGGRSFPEPPPNSPVVFYTRSGFRLNTPAEQL
jgi:hypothetical protein